MSSEPAIILHNALLREFYMACDRCWKVRCENMTPSDLWKTDIKANSQMSPHSPNLSPRFLPAAIWNIKDTESPSAFKRTVKCSTFLVRFWKWSHLKAICLHWNLTCHCYRELSLHGASADGDRHPSSAAFTKRCLMSCRPAEWRASLKICQNVLTQSRECFHLLL